VKDVRRRLLDGVVLELAEVCRLDAGRDRSVDSRELADLARLAERGTDGSSHGPSVVILQ